MRTSWTSRLLMIGTLFSGVSCAASGKIDVGNSGQEILVSVKDQKMALIEDGKTRKVYHISTSKYGLGDQKGSYRTPTGKMQIARMIGAGSPAGTVFKGRQPTGEVLAPNSPGRDPIVSRILWLRGLESKNRNAYSRCIYIHGTPEEYTLGEKRSFGCIRMGSEDVIDLYDRVHPGASVQISEGGLGKYRRGPWLFSGFSIGWNGEN